MDLGDFETTIKVIVVGNGSVGKSSMTARYCKGMFTNNYKKTIGVDFLEKSIELDGGESVKLMIWDTAGQEEFDALTSSYYRGAGACIVVFSTVDRASFDAIDSWRQKVEDECGPIPMALVQNKCDLLSDASMTAAEAEAAAARLGVKLYRSCVKENINVEEVFMDLAARVILGDDAAPNGQSEPPAAPAADYSRSSREDPESQSHASSESPAAVSREQQPPLAPFPHDDERGTRSQSAAGPASVATANGTAAATGEADGRERELQQDSSSAAAASNGGKHGKLVSQSVPSATIKLGDPGERRKRKPKSAFKMC